MTTESIPATIGTNARALRMRAGATLQDVATSCQKHGLRWSYGRVGDLEAGRIPAALPTLLALTFALSEFVPGGVGLTDLLDTDKDLHVNDELTITGRKLREVLSGEKVSLEPDESHLAMNLRDELSFDPDKLDPQDRVRLTRTDVEKRLAKDLGVGIEDLEKAMARLWKRTYTEERDRRAGEHATPQRKGRIGRTLREDLREELSRGYVREV